MDIVETFKQEGWTLSDEGWQKLTENGLLNDKRIILKKALDYDIRDLGGSAFPADTSKGKIEILSGKFIVQIQKIRNISAPKSNEESTHAPRLLKVTVTDGTQVCHALEITPFENISQNTPPGIKLLLKGEIPVKASILFLKAENVEVLGGYVTALYDKWQLNRALAKYTAKARVVSEGGPPPWIQFGEKIPSVHKVSDRNFKSLEDNKDLIENVEFEAQRKDAIEEAGKCFTKKIFGGGTKPLLDKNVQIIMEAGFTQQQAESTLKQTRNNVHRALKILQKKDKENKDKEKEASGRNRKRDEEGGSAAPSNKPSGKISLFEFLEAKLPAPPEKEKSNENNRNNNRGRGGGRGGLKKTIPTNFATNNSNVPVVNNNPLPQQKEEKKSQNTSSYQKAPRFQNRQQKQEPIVYNSANFDNNYPAFNRFDSNVKSVTSSAPSTLFNSNSSVPRHNQNVPPVSRQTNYCNDNIYHQGGNQMFYSNNSEFKFQQLQQQQQQQQQQHSMTNAQQYKFQGMPNVPEYPFKDPSIHNFTNQQINRITNSNNNMQSVVNNYQIDSNKNTKPGFRWKWKIKEKCMAKYWEDNRYYNAEITGISDKTVVVRFLDYGNYEEVLHDDCIPITEGVNVRRPINSGEFPPQNMGYKTIPGFNGDSRRGGLNSSPITRTFSSNRSGRGGSMTVPTVTPGSSQRGGTVFYSRQQQSASIMPNIYIPPPGRNK